MYQYVSTGSQRKTYVDRGLRIMAYRYAPPPRGSSCFTQDNTCNNASLSQFCVLQYRYCTEISVIFTFWVAWRVKILTSTFTERYRYQAEKPSYSTQILQRNFRTGDDFKHLKHRKLPFNKPGLRIRIHKGSVIF